MSIWPIYINIWKWLKIGRWTPSYECFYFALLGTSHLLEEEAGREHKPKHIKSSQKKTSQLSKSQDWVHDGKGQRSIGATNETTSFEPGSGAHKACRNVGLFCCCCCFCFLNMMKKEKQAFFLYLKLSNFSIIQYYKTIQYVRHWSWSIILVTWSYFIFFFKIFFNSTIFEDVHLTLIDSTHLMIIISTKHPKSYIKVLNTDLFCLQGIKPRNPHCFGTLTILIWILK